MDQNPGSEKHRNDRFTFGKLTTRKQAVYLAGVLGRNTVDSGNVLVDPGYFLLCLWVLFLYGLDAGNHVLQKQVANSRALCLQLGHLRL